ncbi:MAG: hypothetical protein KF773_12060 [Deltaproteobacteria bacterium]|nr:hypothetical protein [Deltaproteobacteria bacterium]MCW5803180.1 hypothetical protein [Deltaproteobacteria bacterium]
MSRAWIAAVMALSACAGPRAGRSGGDPCEAVADHVHALLQRVTPPSGKHDTAHERAIRDIFATRCREDTWDVDARDCILAKKALADDARCKDRLTSTQRGALDQALGAEEDRARLAHLPSVCAEYRDRIDQLQTCSAVPQESRETMKQAFTQVLASGVKGSDLEDHCRRGIEAIRRSFSAKCGW